MIILYNEKDSIKEIKIDIIQMDSIKNSNKKVVDYFKKFFYMFLNFKEINNGVILIDQNLKEIFNKSDLINEINPVIPKQSNTYDCGIFILEYSEMIIKHTVSIINKIKQNNFDWYDMFSIDEIHNKREKIMNIINNTFKGKRKIFY